MRFSCEKAESRREFFRDAARYGALGLLAAASALVVRARSLPGRCINRHICGGCGAFDTCGLPWAAAARSAEATQNLPGAEGTGLTLKKRARI